MLKNHSIDKNLPKRQSDLNFRNADFTWKIKMPITVSIIEDDVQTRSVLAEWISESPGLSLIGQCGDARCALETLPALKPDVVLTDINLPAMSGIELVRKLKPLLPETQFLILTVCQDADHIFDALAAGATGYLLKSASQEDLVAALLEVQNGGSPMTSVIARKVFQSFAQPRVSVPADVKLSSRELEVLDLLARGSSFKEVCTKLGISMPTVKTYIRRMYEKLHVCSRSQAVAKCVIKTDESVSNFKKN